jgi:cell division protein ZapA
MRPLAWQNSKRRAERVTRAIFNAGLCAGIALPTLTPWLSFRVAQDCDSLSAVKQSVQVQIAGQTLAIRSDEGPEYVQALADFVDAQVRELTTGRKTTSPQRVALLAAMQIADELFREKDLHARFRAKVEARLRALEQSLDQHESHLAEL